MLAPLTLLSFFSITGGFLDIGKFLHETGEHLAAPHAGSFVVSLATVSGILGVLTALFFYRKLGGREMKRFRRTFSWLNEILVRKYYLDDLYNLSLLYIQQPFAEFLSWFEKKIIVEGTVNQTAGFTANLGYYLRRLQTGKIQTYLSVLFTGVVVLVYFLTIRNLH